MINEAAATLDDITHWTPTDSCKRLEMLRLDLLHPVVSGNKWFKLKYNAEEAFRNGKKCLLTFGGGHSNHLVATAFAASAWGFQSIGIVRGQYAGQYFTTTLKTCESYGMRLVMATKAGYDALLDRDLSAEFPGAHIVPEGGANAAGVRGAAEIACLLPDYATDVCIAMGTGTTLNGLGSGIATRGKLSKCSIHGFYVAKDFARAESLFSQLGQPAQLIIHPVLDQRFGKWTSETEHFIHAFNKETGIPLDVVYTSKMMMKVEALLREGFFRPDSRIVCIHTGGLQGNPAGLFSA